MTVGRMDKELVIPCNKSIIESMKIMDKRRKKLLIVLDVNQHYLGLISIGDLQRAIINNVSMDAEIVSLIKADPVVSYSDEEYELIIERMKKIRAEFMPVLDRESLDLEYVLDWNEIFTDANKSQAFLDCPVVIMAGGKGTRLKPISNVIPKPLLPIGDKTMIEEIISRFRDVGCKKFYLSVNYKKEMIKYYLDNVPGYQDVNYFSEDKPLGTAGSLTLLKGKIESSFFVSNCDILVDQNYQDVYSYHKENKNEITLLAALKHLSVPYGVLKTGDNGMLESIEEKPELTYKINAGVYLLEPHLISEIPTNTFFHITDLIENVKKRNGRIGVYPVSEKSWVDVGEWPSYIETVRYLSNDKNFVGL